VAVAQVDDYKGLFFGTFDASAPTLVEYLGDMGWFVDCIADAREGGIEIFGGTHKWLMNANWKFGADNFSGDSYHVGTSHISAMVPGFGGNQPDYGTTLIMTAPGNGHGVIATSKYGSTGEIPEAQQYLAETFPQVETRLGPRVNKIWPVVGTIFPNLSYLNMSAFPTLRVWHPRGPNKMEVWSWSFVDKAAPPAIKEAVRRSYVWTFGPGGTFEEADGENWSQCSATLEGRVARRLGYNYQCGIGHENISEDFPGRFGYGLTENNQRSFYERWEQLMAATDWSQAPSIRYDSNMPDPSGG
jgi:hypothetical protein